jgi:MFS family permease
MFGRTTERDKVTTVDERPLRARGGVSGGAILTGTVVAFGAFAILSVLIGAILIGLGLQEGNISQSEALQAGIWTAIGLVIAQFLAYVWGGYTAGRMARGSGFANGLLVPILALLLTGLVVAVATGVGYETNLSVNLPFSADALPWNNESLQDWTVGLSIAFLAAMFLGGILGGLTGQRWHTKLENRVIDEEVVERRDDRTVDVREGSTTPGYATVGSGGYAANTTGTAEEAPPPPSTRTSTYGDGSSRS